MTVLTRIGLGISAVVMVMLPAVTAKALIPQIGESVALLPAWLAYSVVDDAYRTCSNELARYGVRVTGMVDSYSGKGGATVVLSGVNAGGYPVTAECNLTIPSRSLEIRYL